MIQASYRRGEYKFYFPKEESVYFNIKGEEIVIQASLSRGKYNLLYY